MARPVITCVGGICWVPSAERTMESTTEIFTKLVTIINTKGTSDSAASASISTSGREAKESGVTDSAATASVPVPPPRLAARAMKGFNAIATANNQGAMRRVGRRTVGNLTGRLFRRSAAGCRSAG